MLLATTRRSLALARHAARRLNHRLSPSPAAAAASSSASAANAPADAAEDDKPVRLDKLLSGLGYGSRREVAALIRTGRVQVIENDDENQTPPPKTNKKTKPPPRLSADSRAAPSRVLLDGAPLDPRPPLTLLLNKPDGYVVAAPDDPRAGGPTVYDLLPERFGLRKPFLGPAGRLDKRTEGLMILTDDGQLAHRITSPKKALWKEYEAELDEAMTQEELEEAARLFASGELVLPGDDGSPSAGRPLLPARLDWDGDEGNGVRKVRVRVCEGRYHQVRRMMAVVGREVVALTRTAMGGLVLGDEEGGDGSVAVRLRPGEWRAATPADLEALFGGGGGVEGAAAGGATTRSGGGEAAKTPVVVADAEEAEMHRRARLDARRREKRRAAKEEVAL
jgi:16S rRNA pseudouridine516 synthase